MTYSTEQIAEQLKAAREAKGLSQRVLAKLADVPQSHISKIEQGAVDLRLSSLVALTRALDLEVTLVPRKALPAVQSIVRRSVPPVVADTKATQKVTKEFQRLYRDLKLALEDSPATKELAQLQRHVRDLQQLKAPGLELDTIRKADKAVRDFKDHNKGLDDIRQILADFRAIRNAAVHSQSPSEPLKPAYSLDDDNG